MSLAARAEALLSRHWWRAQPGLLSRLLQPLSALYGLLARRRRNGITPQAAPVPVLVVGNVVAGGAGKTPTVVALVQALQQAGHRPGVISRGHGRRSGEVHGVQAGDTAALAGDEPLLIQRRTRVPVWVGQDRVAAARALCASHPEVTLLVSDDGLQHHALARQAELLVFDERGAGNGLLLPAGPLREPLPQPVPARMRVLYTSPHASTALAGFTAQRRLHSAWPLAAWHAGDASQAVPLQALRGRLLLAAAGMAAPDKFFSMLRALDLSIQTLALPDHHPYDTLPWPAGTPEVITTEKDAVKLQPARCAPTAVWVVPLDLQLPAGLASELLALLFPPHEP